MEWDVCAHLLLHSLPLKMVRDAFLFQNHGDFFCHSLLLCHQMCTALVFFLKKKVQDQAKKDRKRKRKVNLNFLPCFLWELSVMLIRCAWLCVRACAKHVLAHWYVSWASSPQFSIVVASVTFLCGVKIWELAVSYPLSLLCLLVAWLFHHSVPWTFVSLGKGWWKCSLFVLMRAGVTLLNYP